MTSVFRKRIVNQIVSSMNNILTAKDQTLLRNLLPLSLKIKMCKKDETHFGISWSDVIRTKPDLRERIHPDTVYTYLKNQEFPTMDGITAVKTSENKQHDFTFDVDQQDFTKITLLEVCNNINLIPKRSCLFKQIFPESVIVEFSSPNIAKPFHYGHFRSTIIGNFISNIHKYIGHDVTAINYIGDWGLQYGILAAGYQQFGCEEELKRDPLSHLYEIYVKSVEKYDKDTEFNEYCRKHFQDMESGNDEVLTLWKNLKQLSMDALNKTYKRLGICFEEIHCESMYAQKTKDIYEVLLQKNIASVGSDGVIEAILIMPNGDAEKVVLRKSDGTSLYLSRDIAAAIDRKNRYHFDKMYYVVDSSQSKHFAELCGILNLMNHQWASNIQHVPFGRISNFSTRKGNAVFLHDILNEAQERAFEDMKNSPNTKVTTAADFDKVSEILGISALIINDFAVRRRKNYQFSWEKALNMNHNSGITLQYCHARINGIKENCGVDLRLDCDLSYLVEPEAKSLIGHIARFDEVIYDSYMEFEPCTLVHYLFKLAQYVGRANKVLTVKGQSIDCARARLMLFHSAQQVLAKSLRLLGVTPLNHM